MPSRPFAGPLPTVDNVLACMESSLVLVQADYAIRKWGGSVLRREENFSSVMAKLQRLQDMYSQYFSVSIRILSRTDLKFITIESNGNMRCLANREANGDICDRFLQRQIGLKPDGVLVSMCPFGLLSAIAPLGVSMERGSREETEYFFLAVDNSTHEPAEEVAAKSTV